jgi:hypothetical protein
MDLHNYQELVHLVATPVMVVLYTMRIIILFRHRLVVDKSPDPKGELSKGIRDAFLTLVMPWKMESTRKHPLHYAEFMVFHLGIAFNILLAYVFNFVHRISWLNTTFMVIIAAGLVVGVIRFIRRFTKPDLKIISVFDDYLSLFLVLAFSVFGILALMGYLWATFAYFTTVGVFLIYAPFSKIHHYLYYPFARIFYGSSLARKGILG